MKLIKFDAENARGFKSGDSTIRFSQTGLITLSVEFVRHAGLKAGEKVVVAQDEENPADWYLMRDKKNGFTLRENSRCGGLCFNNAHTVKSIMSCLGIEGISLGCRITKEALELNGEGGTPTIKAFAILTASAKTGEVRHGD